MKSLNFMKRLHKIKCPVCFNVFIIDVEILDLEKTYIIKCSGCGQAIYKLKNVMLEEMIK